MTETQVPPSAPPTPPPRPTLRARVQSLATQLRRRWIVVLGALMVGLFVISIVLRFLTPVSAPVPATPQLIQKNFDGSTTKFISVVFEGEIPEFPENLPMVLAKPSSTQFTALRDQIITAFGMQPSTLLANYWEGADFGLYYDASAKTLQLIHNFLPESLGEEAKNASKEQAITTGQQFLDRYLPNLQLILQPNSIQYAEGSEGFENEQPAQISAVRLPYTYEVQNVPFFYQKQSQYPFLVDVNSTPEVSQALIADHFIDLDPDQEFPLISVEAAVENVRQNKASILSAYNGIGGRISLTQLSRVRLNEVSLEYRVDDIAQAAYPFFRFRGVATTIDNDTIAIEVITPAIQTDTAATSSAQ